MPTSANIGYGSRLAYSTDGAVYNDVGQVVDIDGPDVEVAAEKVTNQDSPNAFHEKIPGLGDAKTLTFNIIHKKAVVQALYAQVRVILYWRLTQSDGATVWTCQGFWTKLKPGVPLENRVTDDLTVEFTGKPTLA